MGYLFGWPTEGPGQLSQKAVPGMKTSFSHLPMTSVVCRQAQAGGGSSSQKRQSA